MSCLIFIYEYNVDETKSLESFASLYVTGRVYT